MVHAHSHSSSARRPTLVHARLGIAVVLSILTLVGCRQDPQKAKDSHVRAGDAYVLQHKYREAVIEFRGAVQAVPTFGPAHLKLGDAYAILGDGRNALREYLKAADLMPNDVPAQLKAGQVLLLAGQFDGARDRAKKLLDADPRNVDAQVLLAHSLAALKDLDGAITEIEGAIETDPQRTLSYSNLGMLQMAKGNRDEADAAFKRALEIDPRSVEAILALANFQWSAGKMVDTEETLKRALAVDAQSVLTHRALATFYLGTQRTAEAEPHLKAVADSSAAAGPKLVLADYYRAMKMPDKATDVLRAVSTDPEAFVAAQTRIASIQYSGGHTDEAHRTIDAVFVKHAKDPQAHLVKARFLAASRQFDEALAHIKPAIAGAPGAPAAHLLAGSIYAQIGKADQAIDAFREVVKLNPRDPRAHAALGRVYASRGEWATVVEHAGAAISIEPRSLDGHLLLARALTERRDFHAADAQLKLLVVAAPDDPMVQYALGRFYLLTNDRRRARVALTAAAADETGDDVAALQNLVTLDFAENRPSDARARVDQRLEATPNSPALLVLAGRTYAGGGDAASAESALRKAIAADPSHLDGYRALAGLFISQKRLSEAREEFETLTTREPTSVPAHTMAAILLEQEGRPVDARKHYEQALNVNPRAAIPANNLAWLMAEGGENLDMALQLAQAAKAELPDRAEVNDTLGWIYYRKGLSTLAIASLKQSVAADPKEPVYTYHLGLAYAKNGDKDQARQALERALAMKPDFNGSSDARAVLTALGSASSSY